MSRTYDGLNRKEVNSPSFSVGRSLEQTVAQGGRIGVHPECWYSVDENLQEATCRT